MTETKTILDLAKDVYNKAPKGLEEMRLYGFIWKLSGGENRHIRKSIVDHLTNESVPVNKCGVTRVFDEILKNIKQ